MSHRVLAPQGMYLDVLQIDEIGRLVLPQDVLRRMGWTEGQHLEVSVGGDGRLTLRQVLEH